MDAEALRDYLDWYKANFASIFAKHEDYKWESVQTFQSAYLPDKANYPIILKEGFKRSENLLNSRSVYSLGMMLDITRFSLEHPDIKPTGIDLFYSLFEGISPQDTNEVLLNKISSFRKQIRDYVRTNLSNKINDYQDLHAVSVYLNHRYPDRFYMYRTSEFTEFNELIGNIYPYEWGSDRNYLAYLNMCDDLNVILRHEMDVDDGFRLAVQYAVHSDEKYYPDPEFRILTQDFIYSVTRYYKRDMIGQYAEQLKPKNLTPKVEYISADELQVRERPALPRASEKETAKADYALRQKENKSLGDAGEEWVFEHEKKMLRAAGRKDLADKVKWVAQKTDSKGYDIRSYDKDGNELYIEVKTTNSGPNTPFYITATELGVSRDNPDKYRLYRVYNFLKGPQLFVITGDINLLKPRPTNFVVYTE